MCCANDCFPHYFDDKNTWSYCKDDRNSDKCNERNKRNGSNDFNGNDKRGSFQLALIDFRLMIDFVFVLHIKISYDKIYSIFFYRTLTEKLEMNRKKNCV